MAAANHEVRTPLASIIAALELLRDGGGRHEAQAAEAFLDLALQNAERLARVVEEWLDMERIDLGFTRLECARVDVGGMLATLVEEHALLAEARDVRLESADAGRVWVSADATRLRQAIAHLLASAIERAPQGSAVRCQIGERENRVTLLIEDEGPDALSSTDLGLGVSRALLERIGGTLCVANRPSIGVAFHVELVRHDKD
jgi:signal transduction histidine kinase